MPRIIDFKKMEIRCQNCGMMCKYCDECKAFKCARCKLKFEYKDGKVGDGIKKPCNCPTEKPKEI